MTKLDEKIAAWEQGNAVGCGYGPDGPDVTVRMPDSSPAVLTLREVLGAYRKAVEQRGGGL